MRAPTEDDRGINEETAETASAIMLLDTEAWLYEHFAYHLLHMAIQATGFRRSINLDRFRSPMWHIIKDPLENTLQSPWGRTSWEP
jgi:hypothetical protein